MPSSARDLKRRQTDTAEAIENRLAKAEYELTFADKFDHIVINDNLEKAEEETYQILKKFLEE